MNYELANELKEARFKQGLEGHYISPSGVETGPSDNSAYIPTLSELIEACDPTKEEFALFSFQDSTWRAAYKNPSTMVMLGEVPGRFQADGSTPEEAVGRLWLALNKSELSSAEALTASTSPHDPLQ